MAVDQDKELDLEDLDLDLEEAGSEQSRGQVLSENDLEQYGVWIKVKPHTVHEGAAQGEQEPRLESLGQEAASSEDTALTEEEEELLGSLEESASAGPVEVDDVGEISLPAEEDLGVLEPEGEQVDLPLSEEPAAGERFEDLSSLEEELGAGKPAAEAVPRSQVLSKIEEELAAIRGELAALKSELVNLRKPGGAVAARPGETDKEAGFFADDSDETIALTGDELDNILNTAEITEEEAADTAAGEEPADLTLRAEPEVGGEALSLEPVAEASPVEASAVEAIPLDEPLEEAPALDTHGISLEIPEEEAAPPESIDLELPDVEEIGLDALEEKPEALEEASPEAAAAEPIEDLEIELTDETLQEGEKAGAQPAEAVGEAALEEEALELPTFEEGLEPAGEEELVLDVPEEVSADLEPLEDLEAEAAEPEDAESGKAGAAEEEISLELPELETPVEESAGAPEELSLEIPQEEIAEAAGATSESVEPLEAVEEIEEIEAAEQRPEPEARAAATPAAGPARHAPAGSHGAIPGGLRDEIRTVLKYMDQLLEALPDDKIKEFADSEYFEVYKRLFEELEIA